MGRESCFNSHWAVLLFDRERGLWMVAHYQSDDGDQEPTYRIEPLERLVESYPPDRNYRWGVRVNNELDPDNGVWSCCGAHPQPVEEIKKCALEHQALQYHLLDYNCVSASCKQRAG
jgi:hypothetical protein